MVHSPRIARGLDFRLATPDCGLGTETMPKAEISWKRVTEDGQKLQVYARHVGREWRFFHRERRFDVWQPVPKPPLEDWLALLDAVQRLITRPSGNKYRRF